MIPIKGNITGPDVQLWPAIFGVMRNAFVEGLTSGYAHLPPATAPKKQGVVEQGVKALAGSQPPKAQPTSPSDPAPPPGAKPDHEPGAETGIPVASTPQGLMREGAETTHPGAAARARTSRTPTSAAACSTPRRAPRCGAFQKSQGLPATGLPSYETVDHLGLELDAIFHSTPRPRDPTAAGEGRARRP